MHQKKFKVFWILIPVLLAVLAGLILFWDSILIHTAPQAVLTASLSKTFSRLEERFEGNPLVLVWNILGGEGQYSAVVELETSNQYAGDVSYDMTVQADTQKGQIMAEGIVDFSKKELGLSMYMDREFMAISSAELTKGNFYGITYDTFSSDLDRFSLLKLLIPDEMILEWEKSVANIQTQMNRSYQMPELSEEDIRLLLAGVLAMKCQVTSEAVLIGGEQKSCYKITCGAAGTDVLDVLSYFMDTTGADSGSITASFYLHQDIITRVVLDGTAGEQSARYDLSLGEDAASDQLLLQGKNVQTGLEKSFSVAVDTQNGETNYVETWSIESISDGVKKASTISYDWDRTTGDMFLVYNEAVAIKLNLTESENGFNLTTNDFVALVSMLLQEENPDRQMIACSMNIGKGSAIATPEYKNLDQWSTEDLLALLKGASSLIGLDLK